MPEVFISKAPDDPDEKKAWANQMTRLQVALWLPASCWCGQPYVNVDDFLARDPRRGYGEGMEFVDAECWDAYMVTRAQAVQENCSGGGLRAD